MSVLTSLQLPSFSIVMPSYNSSKFIRESIESVLNQNYPHLELIVVDGASTDGTVDILKSIRHPSFHWISEPDKGQASAINKGFRMAHGEIVSYLNADDLYEPDALITAGRFFASRPDVLWAFGPCSIVNEMGVEIRKPISWYKASRLRRYSYGALLTENFIAQMGVFVRRDALKTVGDMDESLYWTMDYDLWLRLGQKFEPGLIDKRLGKFRMYSTTKSVSGFAKQFEEDLMIAQKYANGKKWPIILHKINNLKIVTVYRILAILTEIKSRDKKPD